MTATIWSKFFWADWANDEALKLCSFAAQGLWMRMLCIAAGASPTGYVSVNGNALDETGIARLTGAEVSEVVNLLAELERNGVFSRDRQRRIYSRRMIRDAKKRAAAQKNGKMGGNPTLGNQREIPSSDKGQDKGHVKTQEPEASIQEDKSLAQQQAAPPAAAAPNRFDRLLDQLLEANGISGFRTERSPGLANLAAIIGLIEAGFDLEADILASIRQKPNPQARTWGYFEGQIRDYRDTRLRISKQAAPQPAAEDWSKRMEFFRKDGTWVHAWGPKPGERGCRVPNELLRAAA